MERDYTFNSAINIPFNFEPSTFNLQHSTIPYTLSTIPSLAVSGWRKAVSVSTDPYLPSHPYNYCENNPVNYIDPTGLDTFQYYTGSEDIPLVWDPEYGWLPLISDEGEGVDYPWDDPFAGWSAEYGNSPGGEESNVSHGVNPASHPKPPPNPNSVDPLTYFTEKRFPPQEAPKPKIATGFDWLAAAHAAYDIGGGAVINFGLEKVFPGLSTITFFQRPSEAKAWGWIGSGMLHTGNFLAFIGVVSIPTTGYIGPFVTFPQAITLYGISWNAGKQLYYIYKRQRMRQRYGP